MNAGALLGGLNVSFGVVHNVDVGGGDCRVGDVASLGSLSSKHVMSPSDAYVTRM